MLARLQRFIRSDFTFASYIAVGMAVNSFLHLYRFHKLEWPRVTGLWSQAQPIGLSFILCLWTIVPLVAAKPILAAMRKYLLALLLIPLVLIVLNEACGRSMLKLLFDVMLIAILYTWLLVDHGYAAYVDSPPTDAARPFVISELMTIFQISLAILTFVVATFGFSFAPAYIEKYYHEELGQPTVWWFGFMTLYLSIGVIVFVSMQAWTLAVQLRSRL